MRIFVKNVISYVRVTSIKQKDVDDEFLAERCNSITKFGCHIVSSAYNASVL